MAILECSKDINNSTRKDHLNGHSAMDYNNDNNSDENFGKRIAKLQEEYLIPLKEDLADWINLIMGETLTIDNFMIRLDNGVLVCRLAKIIETTCPHTPSEGISALKMKCWENAKSETFYARDNVSNFIQWCRKLKVREAVLFETEDLVLHNNPRSVVLCLLEVARIACRQYMFTPVPGLVELEKEIDAQEKLEMEREARRKKHNLLQSTMLTSQSKTTRNGTVNQSSQQSCSSPSSSDSSDLTNVEDEMDHWSSVSQQNLARSSSLASIGTTSVASTEASCVEPIKTSQLDQKVMLIAKSYYGKKLRHGIKRLAEGKYRIAGKIVFVRLLKDRHVMVRVGGGWDTLQHFLERHGSDPESVKDISPSDLLPMDTRPSESTSRRRNSQSSQMSQPSTPTLRRCLSSTPISRSSLSSPEPWMSSENSSGSSSFTSTSNGTSLSTTVKPTSIASNGSNNSNNHSAIVTPKVSPLTTKLPTVSMKRQLNRGYSTAGIPSIKETNLSSASLVNGSGRRGSLTMTPGALRTPLKSSLTNRSLLSLNLTRHYSTSSAPTTPITNITNRVKNLHESLSTSNNALSAKIRYPNYLSSSQHINKKPVNKLSSGSDSTPSTGTITTAQLTNNSPNIKNNNNNNNNNNNSSNNNNNNTNNNNNNNNKSSKLPLRRSSLKAF